MTDSPPKQETYKITLFTNTTPLIYSGCSTYDVYFYGPSARISFKHGSDNLINFYNAPFLVEVE